MSNEAKNLVRIDHVRCGDWGEGSTYVLAPVEWDEEEIDHRADEAQKAYLKDFSAAKRLPDEPKYPGHFPDFKTCDQSKTVSEVREEHAAEAAIYTEWKSKKRNVSRVYEDYLIDQGFTGIWDGGLSVHVDWGHAHGQAYEYGSDDALSYNFPTPLELARNEKDEDDD